MVFTKFVNPHLELFAPDQIVIVDRAQLGDDDHESSASTSSSDSDDEDPSNTNGLLEILDNMVENAIDVNPPTTSTAPTKQQQKKLRQKQKKEDARPTIFRLFAGPPTPITLALPQHKARPLIRPIEDTEEEARERSERCRMSGVVMEWEDLVRERSWLSLSKSHRKIEDVKADSSGPMMTNVVVPPPTLALTERRRDLASAASTSTCTANSPPPIQVFCPIIHLTTNGPPPPATQPKEPPRRPTPTFFRPDPTLGGKSSGYAYGYGIAKMKKPPHQQRYLRDSMKKGLYITDRRIAAAGPPPPPDRDRGETVSGRRLRWRYGPDGRATVTS